VGDVTGGSQLAHAAEAQGIAAAERICGLAEASLDPAVIPACVYTEPEIAVVGMGADEAKQSGRAVKRGKYVMNANAKSLLEQQERSFVSLLFDAESDRLIGAQLMCARATDLIGELTGAVANGFTRAQLLRAVRPHPTFAEAITEAVLAAEGASIHSLPARPVKP
jgi:dihydrolipoamide dehydrogenase